MRRVPVSFGASREATIESLDGEGRGIARVDGKVIFIEGALAGERVTYRSYMVKPTYEIARADDIFQPSSARVTPGCAFFGVCGGCAMQHVEFRTQVAVKQRVLEDAFERIGKVTPEAMLAPIYGEPWGYRHRARLSSRLVPKKGGVLVGFRERHSSYVADMTDCRVLPPAVSALLMPLRTMIAGLSIAERMPQIEVAVGDHVIVLVLRILDPVNTADEALMRAFADANSVQIWLQSKGPETAKPFHPLDAPALDYSIPEFNVRIGFLPTDFTQVNHRVNQRLVARAVGLLAPAAGERIADLFCGLGNFTLPIARSGARVDGFEGSDGLVRRARDNAALNGIEADFAVANLFVSTEIPDLGQYAKLLIDPPREGAQELVKAIPETGAPQRAPQRIVYVSCDPATLARDAGVLVHTKGYRLVTAGIVNMFPQTAHVESIAMFER